MILCYVSFERWDCFFIIRFNFYRNDFEENVVLYPVEIKLTASPRANMSSANPILDKILDRKRGMGIILCLIDKKTYLRDNLIALPIEYI